MLTDSEVNKRFRHAPTLGYNKRVEWLADQIILNFSILCVIIRTGIVFFIISRQHFFSNTGIKKGTRMTGRRQRKRNFEKKKSLFFLPYLAMPGTWSRDHLFPLFLLLIGSRRLPCKTKRDWKRCDSCGRVRKKRENEGDLRQIAEVPILPRFSIPPLARARSTQEIHMSGEKGK